MIDIENIVKNAHKAFLRTMSLDDSIKNLALKNISIGLSNSKDLLLEENAKDLKEAQIMLEKGQISKATFDRLKLDENKIQTLIQGLNDLIKLESGVNKIVWQKELDEGLVLKKVTCPIGVIGVIFEARPDCFIQISSLIIKSGNCAILKGGKECEKTNIIMSKIVKDALDKTQDFPIDTINLIFSRDDVKKLLSFDEYINLIIPRGSNSLVKYIKENTKIPVLGHASGICNIFVDESADFENVKRIIIDAKTQYPSACNAVETVLLHKNYKYIDELLKAIRNANIEVIENPQSYSIEYSDKILSIKIVEGLNEAIEHINTNSSGHTDSILSKNEENIETFMNLVDSSSVFANCSTRFSDGFRYGFGAEVGISTNKTHARGPVGLDGLMIYKYKLYGSNNIVDEYAKGVKKFNHKFI